MTYLIIFALLVLGIAVPTFFLRRFHSRDTHSAGLSVSGNPVYNSVIRTNRHVEASLQTIIDDDVMASCRNHRICNVSVRNIRNIMPHVYDFRLNDCAERVSGLSRHITSASSADSRTLPDLLVAELRIIRQSIADIDSAVCEIAGGNMNLAKLRSNCDFADDFISRTIELRSGYKHLTDTALQSYLHMLGHLKTYIKAVDRIICSEFHSGRRMKLAAVTAYQ